MTRAQYRRLVRNRPDLRLPTYKSIRIMDPNIRRFISAKTPDQFVAWLTGETLAGNRSPFLDLIPIRDMAIGQ